MIYFLCLCCIIVYFQLFSLTFVKEIKTRSSSLIIGSINILKNDVSKSLDWKYKVRNGSDVFENSSAVGGNAHDCRPVYDPVFDKWQSSESEQCEGKFKAYASNFALLHDVVLHTDFGHGGKGGQEIPDYMKLSEKEKAYELDPGYFTINCHRKPQYKFTPDKNVLNEWMQKISIGEVDCVSSTCKEIPGLTIAIRRNEYANIYFQIMEFYSAFSMMSFFNEKPWRTHILVMDAFPKTTIEKSWTMLFQNFSRAGNCSPSVVKIQNLVWPMRSYNTPFFSSSTHVKSIPLIEQFRCFFLKGQGIDPYARSSFNCEHTNVLVIVRRDYLSHANNPTKLIKRKFFNETEIIQTLKQFPNIHIRTAQMDSLDMVQQLELISQADILIAMHGAGLAHTTFLPGHASLIELFPSYYSANFHFKQIATWRNIYYQTWKNRDKKNEFSNFRTRIPPDILSSLVKNVLKKKCTT